MSGIHRKGQLGASGTLSAGGDDTVDSIFNTRLFTGTGNAVTLTTGVNTSGGGSIWIKDLDNSIGYGIYDQVRGASKLLQPAVDSVEETHSGVTAFGNGNFTIGDYGNFNTSGRNYVVNTFKNTEGFFDTVTWTGDGTTDRSISHNLGVEPGMIIAKQIGTAGDWHVLHKYHTMSGTGSGSTGGLKLNVDTSLFTTQQWEHTYPTSSIFKVSYVDPSYISGKSLNTNSATYIAYLFGHDAVGTDGGKIQVGSYTGNASPGLGGPAVVIGWEPQWLLIKSVSTTESWCVFEQSRRICGMTNESTVNGNSTSRYFKMDTGSAEIGHDTVHFQPDGFRVTGSAAEVNSGSSTKYIWMAIRKGVGNTPTSSSSVFHMDHAEGTSPSPPRFSASFNPDMVIRRSQIDAADAWQMTTRHMQGNLIRIDTDSTVDTGNAASVLSFHNGWCTTAGGADTEDISWMWKTQKGFFDTGIYKGLGSNRTQVHKLGVVPEMMWVKRLDATNDWHVYHKSMNGGSTPEDYYMTLNHTSAEVNGVDAWFDTAPTASVFTVGGNNDYSLGTYIYCLFASVAGVSSIGSFSHSNSTATNVNCGFSSGAKFILVRKRNGGNWYVWDSKRGGENVMFLNLNNAQTNTYDTFDTLNSGFTVTDTNTGGLDTGNWIYYAIAT